MVECGGDHDSMWMVECEGGQGRATITAEKTSATRPEPESIAAAPRIA
jgi:hypothetical protein